jgi:phage shock protein E
MFRALVLVLATIALVASGCGSKSSNAQTQLKAHRQVKVVSPAEFAKVVAEPGTVTLNVLGPGMPSIPGTDLFISIDQLSNSQSRLPSTSTKLAVYCAHGRTSALAVPILEQMGYENIVELRGGMVAWQASGRPLLAPTAADSSS